MGFFSCWELQDCSGSPREQSEMLLCLVLSNLIGCNLKLQRNDAVCSPFGCCDIITVLEGRLCDSIRKSVHHLGLRSGGKGGGVEDGGGRQNVQQLLQNIAPSLHLCGRACLHWLRPARCTSTRRPSARWWPDGPLPPPPTSLCELKCLLIRADVSFTLFFLQESFSFSPNESVKQLTNN